MPDFDPQDVAWALVAVSERQEAYTLYEDYYEGEHRLVFATEKFTSAFGDLFQAFSDNLCAPVVDSHADRLQIEGFDGPLSDAADVLWRLNRMARRSGEVHLDAFKMGDSYVLVWPDDLGVPRIYPQEPRNVAVAYDPDRPGTVLQAAKVWQALDGRFRANLYFPTAIEKWATREPVRDDNVAGLKPEAFIPLDDEGTINPVLNPYETVPMFHFGNNAPVGKHGRSVLRDVVPLQDALNKAVSDMLVAMEFQALPQRWVTGLELPLDPVTHKPVQPPFQAGADRIWALPNTQANFGQFQPADLAPFLAVQEAFRLEICRVVGLPPWVLGVGAGGDLGQSGEWLKTIEGRLVKTIKDRQTAFGESWVEALLLAIQMGNMGGARDITDLEIVWEDPNTRNEKTEVEVQEGKQRLGVSKRQSLRELGYTDEEIEEMLSESQVDEAALGEAFGRLLDSGGQTTTVGQGRAALGG